MANAPIYEGVGRLRESNDDSRVIGLVSAAANGDEAAFAELYEVFSGRIFNLVLRSVRDRSTAEDLCQEIWLKAHKELTNLREPEAACAWLYSIASHACIDFARSRHGRHADDEELLDDLVQARGDQPEETAMRSSEVRMVWETLGSMAPRQSIALYLKQVDGRSYDEIASILNCPRTTVEALLFRARHSFVRAYSRAESSDIERCQMFQQVMAGVVDHEPTRLQRSAIEAHVQDCLPCRSELVLVGKASKGYAALPLLSLSKDFLLPILAGGAATASTGALGAGTAGLLGGAFKVKLLLVLGLLAAGTTAAGTGVVGLPGMHPNSGAAAAAQVQVSPPPDPFTGSRSLVDDALVTNTTDTFATAPAALVASPPGSEQDSEAAGGPADTGSDETGAPAEPVLLQAPLSPPAAQQAPGAGDDGAGPPDNPPPSPTGPAGTLGGGVAQTLDTTLNDVGQVVDDTLDGLGEVVEGVTDGLSDTLAPVDPLVEGLTGISLGDTLTGLGDVLPQGGDTPVGDLLDSLTGPLLGPLLPPTETPPPQASPLPDSTPAPVCLLGLLCLGQ